MSTAKRGRKPKVNPIAVAAWRQAHKATIAETAKRFGVSPTAVKNYCRDHGNEAREARERWRIERELQEAGQLEHATELLDVKMQWLREAAEENDREQSWDSFFEVLDAANRLVPREYRNKKPGEW